MPDSPVDLSWHSSKGAWFKPHPRSSTCCFGHLSHLTKTNSLRPTRSKSNAGNLPSVGKIKACPKAEAPLCPFELSNLGASFFRGPTKIVVALWLPFRPTQTGTLQPRPFRRLSCSFPCNQPKRDTLEKETHLSPVMPSEARIVVREELADVRQAQGA